LNIFKKYRKQKGLTQIELAEILDVDRSTISKWENGENLPKVNKLVKISSILGVPVDELLPK
jgi:transcriptional regulator with XRE-family HTH domain